MILFLLKPWTMTHMLGMFFCGFRNIFVFQNHVQKIDFYGLQIHNSYLMCSLKILIFFHHQPITEVFFVVVY